MILLNRPWFDRNARRARSKLQRRLKGRAHTLRGWKDDLGPSRNLLLAVEPEAEQQIAEVVQLCREHQIMLVPASSAHYVPPVRLPSDSRPFVLLSTNKLEHRVKFAKDNTHVSVQAGLTVAKLAALTEARQCQFPFESARPYDTTVGSLIANNTFAPRGLKHGTMTDYLQDCSIVLSDGTLIPSCREHTSSFGYDMHKLFIGSRGSLGILTNATLKLKPLPDDFRLAMIFLQGDFEHEYLISQIRRGVLRTALMAIANNVAARDFGYELLPHEMLMFVGFEGSTDTIYKELQWVESLCQEDIIALDLGTSLEEYQELVTWPAEERPFHFEALLNDAPCAELLTYCSRHQIAALTYAGTNQVFGHASIDADVQTRQALCKLVGDGGTIRFNGRTPGDELAPVDRPNYSWLCDVKRKLDPLGLFPLPPYPGGGTRGNTSPKQVVA